jgi:lipoate-protein ligase A
MCKEQNFESQKLKDQMFKEYVENVSELSPLGKDESYEEFRRGLYDSFATYNNANSDKSSMRTSL